MKKQKETSRERFKRIAERRVNMVLDDLDSLGKCSNRKHYQYSDADIRKIFREIEKKSKEIKSLFKETGNGKKRFTL